jgi:hypothetical protein
MKKPNIDTSDMFFILGLVLFSVGIGMLSLPGALIATGAIFLSIALVGARRGNK